MSNDAKSSTTNRREFPRSEVHIHARVTTADQVVEGSSEDVSMTGVLVRCEHDLSPGTPGKLRLNLEGSPESIAATCEVVRVLEDGVALSITEIELEDAERLRSLVTLNI